MIEGGCFCGKIRFTIADKTDGEYLVANCHCTMCRRTSAAPFVTWVMVPRTAFRYHQGEPRVLQSSKKGTRHFCPDCGTPLQCTTTDRPDVIDVTTCSLDHPERFVPTIDVHKESRLGWLHVT